MITCAYKGIVKLWIVTSFKKLWHCCSADDFVKAYQPVLVEKLMKTDHNWLPFLECGGV